MTDKTVNRQFRLVGIRSKGAFSEFGTIVPNVSREVMARSGEIESSSGREIAVFEPKRSEDQLQGEFIAGLVVDKPVRHVPAGMLYMELEGDYATARGNIEALKHLHADLLECTTGHGGQIDQEEYIVEIYIPTDNGEDVEIYLPLLSSKNRSRPGRP
jgi:predicted transcriptional regulator YdeE